MLTNLPKKCAIIDSELKKDGDTMTKFDIKMTKTVLLLSKLRPMRGGGTRKKEDAMNRTPINSNGDGTVPIRNALINYELYFS